MLTKEQIRELREHLEKAQNPLFYYDNDADGLCSFLLLIKYLGRGKGVAVRSYPELNEQYARKAKELNADYVFVLDKPSISKEFVSYVDSLGLPLVWIDHHDINGNNSPEGKNIRVYNPAKNLGKDKSYEPVSYLAYKITGRKEDLWIAVAGCIADHYLPDFSDEFKKTWPDYWGNVKEPFDALFKTEIGKIAMALNFGLKDSTSNIVKLQNFLISCRNPRDIFLESGKNYEFRKKYKEIKEKYNTLLERAKKNVGGKLIFFEYSGDLSISSELANELSYGYKDKYVIVAYKKEGVCNLSIRGENVKTILQSIISKFGGASGGGHDNAVGARMKKDDLEKFKIEFIKEINGKRS